MITGVAMRLLDGTVHSLPKPHRHADLILRLTKQGIDARGAEQGFVDEQGVFYRRGAAKWHAMRCGQLIKETHPTQLFSEDVW